MKLLGIFEISHGTGNSSLLDARGVYIRALQIGADSIMLVHNHPSGSARPGAADIRQTEILKKALSTCDISLIDHAVIASDSFYSFADEELAHL